MPSDDVKQWIDSLPDWIMGRCNEDFPSYVQAFVAHYDKLLSGYEDDVDRMMIECGQYPIFKGRTDAKR